MIRSKPMLSAAKDQACVNCGARDGTVVSAHYHGLRGHLFGRGTGHKVHDLFVADLCFKCHKAFDEGTGVTSFQVQVDKSEQFLYLICQTLLRRIDQGIIQIKGYKGNTDADNYSE